MVDSQLETLDGESKNQGSGGLPSILAFEGTFTGCNVYVGILPPEDSVVKMSIADKDMNIELALLCCATVTRSRKVCLTCTDTSELHHQFSGELLPRLLTGPFSPQLFQGREVDKSRLPFLTAALLSTLVSTISLMMDQ